MTNEEVKLVEIGIKLDLLNLLIKNFAHHFRYSIMAWGIALAALIGLLIK